ncbi:LOW QUALITY PROTEIN: hypothetical protein CVT25_008632 [Psilocybe cyanescens]|uniref:Uncharacterized protein n=1 Tax=Psilocybe cyanescens TaxID=93625 RepID=A0A409XDH0_PSICY|nr:LOW QUALITY PROTEIN: hypothetical protein CVT25_008632 [Psilocybe cyanescens]
MQHGPGHATAIRARDSKRSPLPPSRHSTTFYNSFQNNPNESCADLTAWGASVKGVGGGAAATAGGRGAGVGVRNGETSNSGKDEDEVEWDYNGTSNLKTKRLSSPYSCSSRTLLILLAPYHPPAPIHVHPVSFHNTSVNGAFGKCAVPVTPGSASAKRRDTQGEKEDEGRRPGETKMVLLAISARMLLTPPMVPATKRDCHVVFKEKKIINQPAFSQLDIYRHQRLPLCTLLALTLTQISSAGASGGSFKRLISRTICWNYYLLIPVVI